MHKYITKSLLTLTALMSCGLALAQPATQSNEQFYVEGGYAWMTYTDSGYSTTPGVGSVRFGANMNKNLAIEGMLGTTLNDGSITYQGTAISIQLKNVFGMYLKAKTELSDNFEVFAKLGATRATVSASSYYGSAWSTGSSVSYGIGAQVNLNKSVYASVDYMSYYDRNNITAKGPSIGIGVKF